ncbi:MAG: bifunctional diaminohydroxyphosphoribosylaminopyrimidine deaminase/5-amino-6-(5-phosphoribosylamino)uracil reductase RibD [candidate division Zixibacteria bacterium]|nr:bifunctional diaminohydroxyphosphoribosylaminopyrimidine deaminase/5-amino-6-(5-phosphoribosylamino)uracil reductase RibD [candidate division Zixibacteria bacterium]
MTDVVDKDYMRLALSLAEKGRGRTSPNPMVGAVLVKNGAIEGTGYHRAAGKEHAEIVAIRDAGKRSRGATLYVTLEPCCHSGRTGPCSEAIIRAGIRKVVYAVKDPDPRVNSKCARLLRRAGVEVKGGLLRKEARLLNDKYFGYVENGRPYVIVKCAQTLDGRIATRTGHSKWISSPESLKTAHRLRSEVDAVVVGMGTVRHDNPSLTVHRIKGKNPYRIVISASLKFPRQCQLLDNNSDYKTIIATTSEAMDKFLHRKSVKKLIFWELRLNSNGMIDIADFIQKANDFGLRSLLIEGGATLATSFLRSGLVDKYVVFTAPIILGSGINSVGDLNSHYVTNAISLEGVSIRKSGSDCLVVGYPGKDK